MRIPAASCGLVGFKPTHGTMPSSGGWHGLSTQGGIAHRVVDVAQYLETLGGFVLDRLGRIPNPGDQVSVDDVVITVLSKQGCRLKQLLVLQGAGAEVVAPPALAPVPPATAPPVPAGTTSRSNHSGPQETP